MELGRLRGEAGGFIGVCTEVTLEEEDSPRPFEYHWSNVAYVYPCLATDIFYSFIVSSMYWLNPAPL